MVCFFMALKKNVTFQLLYCFLLLYWRWPSLCLCLNRKIELHSFLFSSFQEFCYRLILKVQCEASAPQASTVQDFEFRLWVPLAWVMSRTWHWKCCCFAPSVPQPKAVALRAQAWSIDAPSVLQIQFSSCWFSCAPSLLTASWSKVSSAAEKDILISLLSLGGPSSWAPPSSRPMVMKL